MTKLKRIVFFILAIVMINVIYNIKYINSYFQDSEILSDQFVFGDVETEIVEDIDDKVIIAGENFKKVVRVKNIGKNSCYVRVKVLVSPEEYIDKLNLDINLVDWIYQDGYYYYKKIVNIEEETTPLFTKLTIPSELENGDIFDIDIYSESVQTTIYNNGNFIENNIEIFDKF